MIPKSYYRVKSSATNLPYELKSWDLMPMLVYRWENSPPRDQHHQAPPPPIFMQGRVKHRKGYLGTAPPRPTLDLVSGILGKYFENFFPLNVRQHRTKNSILPNSKKLILNWSKHGTPPKMTEFATLRG